MLSDCIREIAYFADYETTKTLIKAIPDLKDIWRYKCDNYLDFYTGEENYLLQEGKDFVLILSLERYNFCCQNILFEYNDMLMELMNIFDSKDEHDWIDLKPRQRIVIICLTDMKVIGQCPTIGEAHSIVKNNGGDIYNNYMIINMASITPHFVKYGRLTNATKADYKLFCPADLL